MSDTIRGKLRITDVGLAHFAVDKEMMNVCVEGGAHLCDASGKFNDDLSGGDLDIVESFGAEPVGDGLNIGVGGTELPAELSGRQPFVVTGRASVLLLEQ